MTNHRLNRNAVRIALIALMAGGSGSVGAPQPAEQLQSYPQKMVLTSPPVEVALDLSAEQPIVSVRIGKLEPIRMLIDSTARHCVLDDDVARAAGLKKKGTIDAAAAGLMGLLQDGPATIVRVESLSIGKGEYRGFDAIVVDLDKVYGGKRQLDGTISLSLFANGVVTLDFPNRRLVIENGSLPEADDPSVMEYTDSKGPYTIKPSVSGTVREMPIDTTAREACVFPASMEAKMELGYRPTPITSLRGIITDIVPRRPTIKGMLRLGRYRLKSVPVSFKDDRYALGLGVLKHFAVSFDQKNRRIEFTRKDDSPIEVTPPPPFGVELMRQANSLRVVGVFPDSPIAKSVVRVGNLIVELEGRPASSYTDEAIRTMLFESEMIVFTVSYSGAPLLVPVRATGR